MLSAGACVTEIRIHRGTGAVSRLFLLGLFLTFYRIFYVVSIGCFTCITTAAVMASVLRSVLFSILTWNVITILSGQVGLCPPLPCNDQYRYTGTLQPSSELFIVNLIHQMAARRVDATRLRRVCASPGSLLVAVLLFRAGVETNPGPCNQPRRLHSSLVLGC